MKEVDLPSGAKLKISPTPFGISKALYQSILEEGKVLSLKSNLEIGDLLKEIFCLGYSSKKIEAALWECFKYCLYSDARGEMKIDKDTFEPLSAREDYSIVCFEVALENIIPFLKGLFVELKARSDRITKLLS